MRSTILGLVLIVSIINLSYAWQWQQRKTCCTESKSVDASKIIFTLYNVDNLNGKIINDYVFPERGDETFFLTHGEEDSEDSNYWIRTMTSEYITLFPESDVIHVNWYFYTKNKNYVEIACYVPGVARVFGDFVVNVTKNSEEVNKKLIHAVGFALGAHVTGLAGRHYFKQTGDKFGKMTGLDPPALCFNHVKKDKRLSNDDSERLWVLHTSKSGIAQPIGRADFYINGGRIQPLCNFGNTYEKLNCSHYYAATTWNRVLGLDYLPTYPCPDLGRHYNFEFSLKPQDCSPISTFNLTVPTNNSTTGIFYVKSSYP